MLLVYLCFTTAVLIGYVTVCSALYAGIPSKEGIVQTSENNDIQLTQDSKVVATIGEYSIMDGTAGFDVPCNGEEHQLLVVYDGKKLLTLCTNTLDEDKLKASFEPKCHIPYDETHLIDFRLNDANCYRMEFCPNPFTDESQNETPYFNPSVNECSEWEFDVKDCWEQAKIPVLDSRVPEEKVRRINRMIKKLKKLHPHTH